ncbi:MAG TPA: hypothetical protein VFR28_03550 [Allosphingosinicella sp.]|jgi:hypothetical protein|nr:hypothetical protein [Allosphingosinicella sp.]
MMIEDRGIGGVFLERAAAEELGEKLSGDGWLVSREADIDGNRIDLVARRGDETIFYEFKLAGSPSASDWAAQLVTYQQLARRHGAGFRLVLVRPPREMELEVEGVERMLYGALVQSPPWQVADIAGHTLIDEVEGVDLTAIRIRGVIAEVDGEAILGVTLQTGAGELVASASFPFTFSATLDLGQERADAVEVHEMDLSSWYGDDFEIGDDDPSEDGHGLDQDDPPF